MASPHAVGVAALIVSEWGHPDGGKKTGAADDEAEGRGEDPRGDGHGSCVPESADDHYMNVGRPASFDATCTGTADFNSIWGEGIVDALAAVTGKK